MNGSSDPAAVLHQLLTAGVVIAQYSDTTRMLEFAAAALETIPSVGRCAFYDDAAASGADDPDTFCYLVPMETADRMFGRVELLIRDRELFAGYETAVHNLAGLIAMRMENLEYQAGLEDQVRSKTVELERLVRDRELLLREVHHRVKNNLSIVGSLLNLQFGSLEDDRIRAALQSSTDRIQSIALVHEFLYESETLSSIDFRAFTHRIVGELSSLYRSGGAVSVVPEIADVPIGIEIAVPLSLIINELVTNALKYAFAPGTGGTILVRVAPRDGTMMELLVRDDGRGLPPSFDPASADSLGMQLVQGLAQQLRGTITVDGEGGASFRILFPA